MTRRFPTIAALLLLICLASPSPARAEESEALQQLLESAEYWKQRGRTDKLLDVWARILMASPDHAPTLAELALHHARAGQEASARDYLKRLEAVQPGHAAVAAVKEILDGGDEPSGDDRSLSRARALVKAGRVDEAIPLYRKYFGQRSPGGSVGIEFYQTLGGTDAGWQEAHDGLARIAAERSGDARAALALAQHQTYRAPTRRDGIAGLEALADDPAVGEQARRSWRQALDWLRAVPADGALYRRYLEVVGDDATVRTRLDSLNAMAGTTQPVQDRLDLGFAALEEGDLERAEAIFDAALTRNRRNLDAMVGMASVEMQREEFAKARARLERIKSLAPRSPSKWEKSLASARFWEAMAGAERAAVDGDVEAAEALLEDARAASPNEGPAAEIAVGHLFVNMGNMERADEHFTTLQARYPDNAEVLQALVGLRIREGRFEDATGLNEKLVALDDSYALATERVQSEAIRSRASFEYRIGDLQRSVALLQEAQRLDPENPWVLFDLVHRHAELGQNSDARDAMDRLLAVDPHEPHFQLANARLLASERLYDRALASLEAIPSQQVTRDMRDLRRQLEVQLASDAAVRRATHEGAVTQARRRLTDLEREVAAEPELMGIVALAWADLGDPEQGLMLIRSAEARTMEESASLRLRMAAILLRASRLEELDALVIALRDDPDLGPRELRDLDSLRVALGVSRADRSREKGDLATSAAYLSALLQEFPDDPRVINALGRQRYSAGDFDDAEQVFMQLVDRDPEDVEARQGAMLASLELGKKVQARELIAEGLELRPEDPRMHLAAARARIVLGNDSGALRALREAERLAAGDADPGDVPLEAMAMAARDDGDTRHFEDIVAEARSMRLDEGEREGAGPVYDATLYGEIQREINAMGGRHRPTTSGLFQARHRRGEAGLSQLTELSVPIRASIPTGFRGAIEIGVRPVELDTGVLAMDDSGVAERFGSFGSVMGLGGEADKFRSFGVAIRGGYRYRGFAFHVGSSPLGFPTKTVLGDLEIGANIDHFGFRLSGARALLTDSLLSYAGVEDPRDGEVWGAVTANGGQLDLSVDRKPVLFYLFGGYDVLLGREVLTNGRWRSGAGLHWTAHESSSVAFTIGVAGNALGHTENLRYFTRGHGGYFSPQLFINAGVPIVFGGTKGPFSYELRGQVGLNWFREDEASYYPLDDALQTAREQLRYEDGTSPAAVYEGRDVLSFALDAGLTMRYAITDNLDAGLDVHIYTAEEYTEFMAGIGVGYTFGRSSSGGPPRSVGALTR